MIPEISVRCTSYVAVETRVRDRVEISVSVAIKERIGARINGNAGVCIGVAIENCIRVGTELASIAVWLPLGT